jgi:site-specific DNA-methyltransferase (adenine-specific)
MNYLYLGDCLDVLREWVADESVDLIYIDPPFNSKRNYNMFFDTGDIQTQRIAFEDTWSLKNIQDSLAELQAFRTEKIHSLLMIYGDIAPSAFPYLVMMALRILELHRVLKPTGSFYLHCDPNMSHYLKTLCDLIFGKDNFRNEIIWSYKRYTAVSKRFQRLHDDILYYSKSEAAIFNDMREKYGDKSGMADSHYKQDENGNWFRWQKRKSHEPYKIYLSDGKRIGDVWEMPIINASSKERLGYPTQKPKALLERIINASSNEGDVVLDAFCGCGTSVDAAESLKRQWIGIDISPIAISLIQKRIKETYGQSLLKYEVRGIPKDEQSAIRLWKQNPFAFQDWWITEFCAFSMTYGKKGADKGVDGIAKYRIDADGNTIKAAFQVKGGKVQSKDIDALMGAMVKHRCELGVFLSIEPLTKPMLDTIARSGVVRVPGFQYPKLQSLTLAEFFTDKKLKLPQDNITYESAKLAGKGHRQIGLE